MASLIIASTSFLLDDLELRRKRASLWFDVGFIILVLWLRNIKIFLLGARKLGKVVHLLSHDNCNEDESIKSLLFVDHAVCTNVLKIHLYCLSLEDEFVMDIMDKINCLRSHNESFEKEIDEWHNSLVDYSGQSIYPTVDEVMDIINSVKQNLVDFLLWGCFDGDGLQELIEALAEKLAFLENFIRFSTLPSLGNPQLEDLLLHIEDLAINIAHLSYLCQLKIDVKEVSNEFSVLLQKINFFDSKVCKTYAKALTSFKLLRQLDSPTVFMHDDPRITLKGFIGSLTFHREMLQVDTFHLVSMKDQVKRLYEELRFLRKNFQEQSTEVGEIVQMQNEKKELHVFWNGFLVEAYKVGFFIDYVVFGGVLDPFSTSFDSIMENTRKIETDVLEILNRVKDKQITITFELVSSQSIDTITAEVLCFDGGTSIIDELSRDQSNCRLLPSLVFLDLVRQLKLLQFRMILWSYPIFTLVHGAVLLMNILE